MVGLRPRLAGGGDARASTALMLTLLVRSDLPALGHKRVPGASGFRLDMRETCARWRFGDPDQVLTRRTLHLATGVTGVAF